MSQPRLTAATPPAIVKKLRLIRSRKFRMHVTCAVTAAVAVLLAAMGVAMLVDWLATLYDSVWRTVLTAAAIAAAAAAGAGWLALARHSLRWERLAQDVDRQLPQSQERWTTVAHVGRTTPNASQVHPAMYRRVANEALRLAPSVQPDEVVTLSLVLKTLLVLTGVTVVLAVAVVLDSRQTLVLMRRFWSPNSLVSATEISIPKGDAVVGRGESFDVEATIEGTLVDKATLFMQTDAGREEAVPLVARKEPPVKLAYRIEAIEEPLKYRLRAGDGQTPWRQIDIADRPELSALQIKVTPPAYTGQAPSAFSELPRQISALAGSRLEIALRPKAPVKSCQLRLNEKRSANLSCDVHGWYRWTSMLEVDFSLTATLTESHGLTNKRPLQCKFVVFPDAPPAVKVLAPDDEIAVRPDDTVEITFSASDDVGIGAAELIVYENGSTGGETTPITTIPIPLGDQVGAAAIQQAVQLDLSQFKLHDGNELSYEIRVHENRGNALGPDHTQLSSNRATATQRQKEEMAAAPPADSKGLSEQSAAESGRQGGSTAAQFAGDNLPKAKPPASSRDKATATSVASRKVASRSSVDQPSTGAPEKMSPPAKEGPQTTTSGRKNLTSETGAEQTQPTINAPTDSTSLAKDPADQTHAATPQSANEQSPATARSAAGADDQSSTASDPTPADNMPRHALDVPQTSSSQRMRIVVDQWAGSYSGQQRLKLEVAIVPELEALDQALAKAQRTSRGILEELKDGKSWRDAHAAETSSAEQSIVHAKEIIGNLERRTINTPYAFVGLQVTDIGLAHVEPARSNLWKARQTAGEDRHAALSDALQHLGRARDLLAELRGQYERTRREFQLAESVEKVKKMYQIFVENSQTLLKTQPDDPTRYNRALAQFDLDDDYLKRLQEVLEMRRDLRAELARILAQDPRLLRRFMDALRNRTNNLREELADLHAAQTDLNREVKAFVSVEENDRTRIGELLLSRHVSEASDMAKTAGELQSRYQTWLPLDRQSKDADLVAATKTIQEMATAAETLGSAADEFVNNARRPKAPTGDSAGAPAASATPDKLRSSIGPLLVDAQSFYERLVKLEVALRQLATSGNSPETAAFAANRLLDARLLIGDASAWIRQLQAHKDGKYAAAAEIAQYRLAMETERLAGKLGGIEQSLSALLERRDGDLPKPIAEKSREFLAILDKEASPNQLAAVYSLRSNQLPRAVSRQQAAEAALGKAEEVYDELMRRAIGELDKLPVQDPIADLLDDPTLDELLALLEQEPALNELLGIPARPSNLRIVDDWMQSGGGGISMGAGMQMLMHQMQQDQERARQQLDHDYRRAIARALKEATPRRTIQSAKTIELSDWNRLASRLSDDLQQGRDKAPPEQYRRAIEQYFAHISRVVAESDRRKPRGDSQ